MQKWKERVLPGNPVDETSGEENGPNEPAAYSLISEGSNGEHKSYESNTQGDWVLKCIVYTVYIYSYTTLYT